MNAKQLERFMAAHGGNASAMDVVIRELRKAFNLSTGGRGLNAARLADEEISWVLLSYAGSEVAARASQTLKRLLDLMGPSGARHSNHFVVAFQQLIAFRDEDVLEVRICRNFNRASIRYASGQLDVFTDPGSRNEVGGGAVFRSEGVLSGELLKALFEELGS